MLIFVGICCVSANTDDDMLSSSSDSGTGAFSSEDSSGAGDGSFNSKDSDVQAPEDDDYDDEDETDESHHVDLTRHATANPIILLLASIVGVFSSHVVFQYEYEYLSWFKLEYGSYE